MLGSCLICKGKTREVVFEEFGVNVFRCRSCGHIFSGFNRPDNYDGYWGSGEGFSCDEFWFNTAHEKMYDAFCRRFISGRSGRLLDVGCGTGHFLKKLRCFPGWESVGFEVSSAAVEYARRKLGLTNVFCGPVERSDVAPESFDIITLWDVIEHISQPDVLLGYLWTLLKKDGILFLHTPNCHLVIAAAYLNRFLFGMREGMHYLEARDHMHLYSPVTISRLLERNAFEVSRFIHLPPIQSLANSRSLFLAFLKNIYVGSATAICALTAGRCNMDNLFVVAKRGSDPARCLPGVDRPGS